MAITAATSNVLWGKCRDQCAFPGCIQASSVANTDAMTGEVFHTPALEHAHIRSKKPDGPRYDPDYPAAKLDQYDNLILLCPTHHHAVVDAEKGRAYTAKDLERMRDDHVASFDRLETLEGTLTAYLGEQFVADDKILFEQAQLRGPSVDSMFVDVPFTCRSDAAVAEVLRGIASKQPGDLEASARTDGQPVTGAAQAMLNPSWKGNALLVGGPGQGKSTLLQYLCQFNRARLLGEAGYAGERESLNVSQAQARFPIRIDLRNYAQWARRQVARSARRSDQDRPGRRRGRSNPPEQMSPAAGGQDWPTIEEFLSNEITTRAATGGKFGVRDLATMVSTRAMLICLDGLDEIADLADRERVSECIVSMSGRLQPIALDLVVLVATRPGGTTPQLWSSSNFPRLDLLPLSQGLRLQYLRRWCKVAGFTPHQTDDMQREFMKSEALPHIRDLAAYPMQLAILLHMLYRQQLMPEKRTKLYDEYFDAFLTREQAADKEPLLARERPLIERVHAYLGWYIQTETEAGRSNGAITGPVLKRELRRFLADRDGGKLLADKLFDAFTTRMLCLNAREHDAYQFEVQTLREYFTAIYLFEEVRRDRRDQCLTGMLRRPYWSNVLRFYVGRYSDGEVRGLVSLFAGVAEGPPASGIPLVRATAAQLLRDRVYQGQKSRPFEEIVGFILSGAGVVFAEDGLLDGGGGALAFSDQAGRLQAVEHLKGRLEQPQTPEMTRVLCHNLARHSEPEDDIAKWAKKMGHDDATWFSMASSLGFLNSDLPGHEARVEQGVRSYSSDTDWASQVLDAGGYRGSSDVVVSAIIADFNDGAYELIASAPLNASTPGRMTGLALQALGTEAGADGDEIKARRRIRSRAKGTLYQRLNAATAALPALPASGPSDWAKRLDGIAEIWGGGWILQRAIGSAAPDVDPEVVASMMKNPRAVLAAERLQAMREHLADSDWWAAELNSVAKPSERALTALRLYSIGQVAVFVDNAEAINALLNSLPDKYFAAVHAALQRDSTPAPRRQLFIGDAIRRSQTQFGPRALWLLRLVAPESGLEHIARALRRDPAATINAIGGVDLRGPLRVAAKEKKVKVAAFKGKRRLLPTGGWASDVRVSLTMGDISAVLNSPIEWPADIVHLAAQKAAAALQAETKLLQQLALDEEWLSVEN